ncbi:hypothetical protein DSECCO2_655570 [anaerobic digester metagenome]|nr:hypothetical protein [Euryarchaeota archaeon]
MKEVILSIRDQINTFEEDAHRILAKHEASKSRIITVEQSKRKLTELSLQQENLLEDSLTCIERGLYKPSYVMAWAAFIDFLEEKLASDGLKKVKKLKPNWSHFKDIGDLREKVPESQLLDVAKEAGLLSGHDLSILKGDLIRRNKCAHPSDFDPDMNDALGYVSGLVKYITKVSKKSI